MKVKLYKGQFITAQQDFETHEGLSYTIVDAEPVEEKKECECNGEYIDPKAHHSKLVCYNPPKEKPIRIRRINLVTTGIMNDVMAVMVALKVNEIIDVLNQK